MIESVQYRCNVGTLQELKDKLDTSTKELAYAVGEDAVVEMFDNSVVPIDGVEDAVENHLADVDEFIEGQFSLSELIEFLLETRDRRYVWRHKQDVNGKHRIVQLSGGEV